MLLKKQMKKNGEVVIHRVRRDRAENVKKNMYANDGDDRQKGEDQWVTRRSAEEHDIFGNPAVAEKYEIAQQNRKKADRWVEEHHRDGEETLKDDLDELEYKKLKDFFKKGE